jgi:hypothetical protein
VFQNTDLHILPGILHELARLLQFIARFLLEIFLDFLHFTTTEAMFLAFNSVFQTHYAKYFIDVA